MNKAVLKVSFFIFAFLQASHSFGIQRFPKPEFESGHTQPPTIMPNARAELLNALDVLVLVLSLTIITWFILKKRSRRGVFWTSVFSLFYFGFFRLGCVCSVGSLQNITLALADSSYHIPWIVIAFFALPLLFSLFFGRIFCAGVCPLGAIQEIVAVKPLNLKPWVQKVLGLIPFIYLGLAILYAATSTEFIICRYDPFVGIFRFDGTFMMFVIGGILLLVGVFIARPYCRFLCPYSVLLNWTSRFSAKHLSITPSECIQCKLCEDSCPYGAIEKPVVKSVKDRTKAVRRFIILVIAIPLFVFVGGLTGSIFHENLASVNQKVELAEEIIQAKQSTNDQNQAESIEITAFKSTGKSETQLFKEVEEIYHKFYIGGWIFGGFIGLVFAFTFLGLSKYRYRENYEPNRGSCLSCARCIDYCPVQPNKQ